MDALVQAIADAAEYMPRYWTINLCVEQARCWITMEEEDGNEVGRGPDPHETYQQCIRRLIDTARHETSLEPIDWAGLDLRRYNAAHPHQI